MKDQIRAAEGGDRAAAKYLVARAADDLSRGISLDEDLALWLGMCLTQISEGVDPGQALGISGPGKPPASDEDLMKRHHCFVEVERLIASGQAKRIIDAEAIVAEEFGWEVATVNTYRKNERRDFLENIEKNGGDIKSAIELVINPWPAISLALAAVDAIPQEELIKLGKAAAARIRGKQ